MPELDGFEVCRQLRAHEDTAVLPVIMLTASEGTEKTKAIEAGADDFIPKPFNHDELLARVRSLLRIKRYHDEIAELNRTLEDRVADPAPGARPHCSGSSGSSHRSSPRPSSPPATSRSCQSPPPGGDGLRGPPRLDELRRLRGARRADARARRVPPDDRRLVGASTQRSASSRATASSSSSTTRSRSRTRLQAVRLGCALREEMAELTPRWQKRGHELDFGAGIALGYATCGEVGFEGRSDYAAIGAVTNLASRLADEATGGQVLIAQRLYAEVEDDVVRGWSRHSTWSPSASRVAQLSHVPGEGRPPIPGSKRAANLKSAASTMPKWTVRARKAARIERFRVHRRQSS